MSAQAAKKEPAAEAAPKKGAAKEGAGGKKGKLPVIIIAAVVLVGGGGAGAWFAFKHKPAVAADAQAAAGDKDKSEKSENSEKSAKKSPPLYYKFDPAFVVNFGGEGSARYLQVTVEAMAREQGILETLKNDEPAVRNDLVMLFSGQDNATLMSPEGKDKLRGQTLEAIRKVLNSEGAKGSQVEAVYFTSFVIQ
jgi:flagellar FliL protein